MLQVSHIAKLATFENNRLTIEEQKNAIENFKTLLLTASALWGISLQNLSTNLQLSNNFSFPFQDTTYGVSCK